MSRVVVLALLLVMAQEAVAAVSAATSTATGPAALALASVVAEYSSSLTARDKSVLARLFDGHLDFRFPAHHKILVRAEAIVCRASDIDITARACELTFGTQKRILKGRRANELDATVAAAGVPSEGAAGSIILSLSHLVCTLDPNEIKRRAGGGADCTFATGRS
jgi:hypothetical protein